jgi:hypothetical protein
VRQKVLPIVLSPQYQAALERRARASERDAVQEARWIIKQVLDRDPTPDHRADRAAVEAAL